MKGHITQQGVIVLCNMKNRTCCLVKMNCTDGCFVYLSLHSVKVSLFCEDGFAYLFFLFIYSTETPFPFNYWGHWLLGGDSQRSLSCAVLFQHLPAPFPSLVQQGPGNQSCQQEDGGVCQHVPLFLLVLLVAMVMVSPPPTWFSANLSERLRDIYISTALTSSLWGMDCIWLSHGVHLDPIWACFGGFFVFVFFLKGEQYCMITYTWAGLVSRRMVLGPVPMKNWKIPYWVVWGLMPFCLAVREVLFHGKRLWS